MRNRLALAVALALGLCAGATQAAAQSVISAEVADSVGIAVMGDGTVTGASGTVPMSITREERDGVLIVTVAPSILRSVD